MATSLSVTLDMVLRWTYSSPLDLSTPKDMGSLDLSDTLANGVAAAQVDMIWHDQRTLVATSEDLDFAGVLPNTLTGSAMTFAKIKGIAAKIVTTDTGKGLTFGGAAANAWTGLLVDASDKAYIGPDGIFLFWSPVDGVAVTGGSSDAFKVDAGANTVIYNIIVLGCSS